ncbi:AraC family transcriptional regulator [Danxiaibacter flavus]|uniref:AraC family transcriptional regulator n=1 Tax=Danxiaibacter flavus TaxID=3049108 RepID=A0ABV3ZI65_9BACT|nr:AraC family transcriptional regulator [Chitinophagaceae bacterium DXS]
MKKEENTPHKPDSISDVHKKIGLPPPVHPLISLINNTTSKIDIEKLRRPHILSFYKISYKTSFKGRVRYGQGYYDFDGGGLLFASPNQVIGGHDETTLDPGYTLIIHPDFLLSYPLAKKIKQHSFFSYSVNEALHLSDTESATIASVFKFIEDELNSRIDDFSQDVIIAQLELLLNYANRFYKRQFLTRKAVNNELLQKLEDVLEAYFNDDILLTKGVPTVQYLAEQLNFSPSYLSDMLRSQTGYNAQQHIHNLLIEKAKEKLSTTNLSVSEVAYALGFEYPQSFSKLFKAKTDLSPLEFRRAFN